MSVETNQQRSTPATRMNEQQQTHNSWCGTMMVCPQLFLVDTSSTFPLLVVGRSAWSYRFHVGRYFTFAEWLLHVAARFCLHHSVSHQLFSRISTAAVAATVLWANKLCFMATKVLPVSVVARFVVGNSQV